ncbi:MAG: hypothetical protein FJ255_06415 [Phycisphaerae bacterium]|nr:hypothetical protein [Phycisphaerae bacterium]
MNTQELIELAQLDALCLLDEREREAFERAFAAASPAVRRHVREEQARFAQLDMLLPMDEPPAILREKVLARIRAAMAESSGSAGPLRLSAGELPIGRSRRVSPLWRAAALGFATAAVLLGAVSMQMFQQVEETQRNLRDGALVDEVRRAWGTRYVEDVLFDAGTTRVAFRTVGDQGGRGQASVFINPEWSSSLLFSMNLSHKQDGSYRLVVVDDRNQVVHEVGVIRSEGGLSGQELPSMAGARGSGGEGRRLAITFEPISGDAGPVIVMEEASG